MNRTQTISATLTAAAVIGIGAGFFLHTSGEPRAAQQTPATTAPVPSSTAGPGPVAGTRVAPPTLPPTSAASRAASAPSTVTSTELPTHGPATSTVVVTQSAAVALSKDALLTPTEINDGRVAEPVRLEVKRNTALGKLHPCQTTYPADSTGVDSFVTSQGTAQDTTTQQLVLRVERAKDLERPLQQIASWHDCSARVAKEHATAQTSPIRQVRIGERYTANAWSTLFTWEDGTQQQVHVMYVHTEDRLSLITVTGPPRLTAHVQAPILLDAAAGRLG